MTSSDPIADMLTRVRNAVTGRQQLVSMPSSKIKVEIAKILHSEGYLDEFEESEADTHKTLRLKLKYVGERRARKPVITGIKRISSPGRRTYVGKTDIPWVRSGMGVAILTTPKGVMTGVRAKQLGVGGELLCEVW